jgi:hypothetical protein
VLTSSKNRRRGVGVGLGSGDETTATGEAQCGSVWGLENLQRRRGRKHGRVVGVAPSLYRAGAVGDKQSGGV